MIGLSVDLPAHGSRLAGPFFDPAFGRDVVCTIEERDPSASDEANTAQSIEKMRGYSIADSQAPIIQRATAEAAAAGGGLEGLHQWIRSHVRYVPGRDLVTWWRGPDADEDQVLIRPADLLAMPEPSGDCAVFSMLTAAMARALGFRRIEFKTVKADRDEPDLYSHVYAVVDGVPMDTSHGPYPGWEVSQRQAIYGERLWTVTKGNNMPLGDWLDDLSSSLDASLNLPSIGSTPSVSSTVSYGSDSSDGFDWGSLINTGLNDAAKILGTRYSVPQLNAGQTVKLANGTLLTQSSATTAVSSAANTGIIIGGLALLLIAVLAMKK